LKELSRSEMPGHYLFKYPQKPAQNVGVVLGILNTTRWQLTQPRVKPYRPAGVKAGEILTEVERGLLGQARDILLEALGQV